MTTPSPAPSLPPQYIAPARRPPLPASMARAARMAGGVGFGLLTVGWSLFFAAAFLGVLWAAFAAILAGATSSNPSSAAELEQVQRWLATLPTGLLIGLLVAAAIVGALLWTAGLLVSARTLRRSGHPRPWAVTWAGFGLSVLASWLVYGIVQIASQIVGAVWSSSVSSGSDPDVSALVAGVAVQAGVWLLVSLVIDVVAGVLLWWAMAVAMRPAAPAAATVAPVGFSPTPGTFGR